MRVSHKEHPGWGRPYCKVLQTGTIKIGDAVRVTSSEQRKQKISAITLVVRDYDEAIDYFTNQLGFDLVEDTPLEDGKRWVRVLPAGGQGTSLLLAKAVTPSQVKAIGSQTGGRVFLLLQTDDFWRDYRHMQTVKVKFLEAPREESYGTVAVFEDLYGNRWDLIELKE
ncbi:MAG: VOC family protein [Anaerolineales bacterium]|nr:VOC family protein [Anaerolineales bacterium]